MMTIVRIAAVGLLLVILAVGGLVLFVDRIAKSAVESGTESALGVDASLGSAHVGLFSGEFGLTRLVIGNPPGYEGDPFVSLRGARMDVGLATLLDDTVVVPLFALDGLRLRLVSEGRKTNFGQILDKMKQGGASGPPPEEEAASAKKFVVNEVRISDVVARVEVRAAGRTLRELEVPVPEIRLRDVGSESSGGVVFSQLSATLTQAVLEAVARQGGALPGELRSALQANLRGLPRVGVDLVGAAARGDAKGVTEEAGRAVREEAGKRLRELGEGLFGREKEE